MMLNNTKTLYRTASTLMKKNQIVQFINPFKTKTTLMKSRLPSIKVSKEIVLYKEIRFKWTQMVIVLTSVIIDTPLDNSSFNNIVWVNSFIRHFKRLRIKTRYKHRLFNYCHQKGPSKTSHQYLKVTFITLTLRKHKHGLIISSLSHPRKQATHHL